MGAVLAVYVLLVLVVVPVLSWRSAAGGVVLSVPRTAIYRGAIGTAWVLALLGATALAWNEALSAADVGLVILSPVALVIATLGTLAAAGGVVTLLGLLRAAMGREESAAVRHLVPRTPPERRLYVGVALSAGLTEEFVYRGVVLMALTLLPGLEGPAGVWAATAVTSLAFGVAHGYQDPLGMLRAGALGFILALPFLWTGSLLPGMVAHAFIDLLLLTPAGRALIGPGTEPAGEAGSGVDGVVGRDPGDGRHEAAGPARARA